MPDSDFLGALRALRDGGAEFVVVGGLAAVLNGAPISAFDLDIVPARAQENVERLLRVLDTLDAIYRMQSSRRLRPDVRHLCAPGHKNLLTTCGPLDVSETIGRGLDYEDLSPQGVELEIGRGVRVRLFCGVRSNRRSAESADVSPSFEFW